MFTKILTLAWPSLLPERFPRTDKARAAATMAAVTKSQRRRHSLPGHGYQQRSRDHTRRNGAEARSHSRCTTGTATASSPATKCASARRARIAHGTPMTSTTSGNTYSTIGRTADSVRSTTIATTASRATNGTSTAKGSAGPITTTTSPSRARNSSLRTRKTTTAATLPQSRREPRRTRLARRVARQPQPFRAARRQS